MRRVHLWHRRASTFSSSISKQILLYVEAITYFTNSTCDISNSSTLWIALADLYERYKFIEHVCFVYEDSLCVFEQQIKEFFSLISQLLGFDLRFSRYFDAMHYLLCLLRIPGSIALMGCSSKCKITYSSYCFTFFNRNLWDVLGDLDTRFGSSLGAFCRVHMILRMRLAFSDRVCLFALQFFLRGRCEQAYTILEKASSLYCRSGIGKISTFYLGLVYLGTHYKNVQRTRDLYEKAIQDTTRRRRFLIYILYAYLEQKLGSVLRLQSIYIRASRDVHLEYRLYFFKRLISLV